MASIAGTRRAGHGALLAVLIVAPALARANTPQECISLWDGLSRSNQTRGIAQHDFMAACLAHKVTGSTPAILSMPDGAPPGVTRRCRDGMYTTATVPLAGCQAHGGLAGLLRP
jgi:hypothetical protein